MGPPQVLLKTWKLMSWPHASVARDKGNEVCMLLLGQRQLFCQEHGSMMEQNELWGNLLPF